MNKDIKNEEIMDYEDVEFEDDGDIYANQDGIKSKERVKEHGEVFTPENIVKDMLNMDGIREESYKLESTFLEPSCGNGNFLVEILRRKLQAAKALGTDKKTYNLNVIKGICSIYGVDIMGDNIIEARERLRNILMVEYLEVQGCKPDDEFMGIVDTVFSFNIILGDMIKHTMTPYNPKTPVHGVHTGTDVLMFIEWNFDGENVTEGLYEATSMDQNLLKNFNVSGHYTKISEFITLDKDIDRKGKADDDYDF